jgi:hypothetical protein
VKTATNDGGDGIGEILIVRAAGIESVSKSFNVTSSLAGSIASLLVSGKHELNS